MKYWLVQRLSAASKNNGRHGFDSHFQLDYMGSAEYEFRTPNEALHRMRNVKLQLVEHTVTSCGGKPLDAPRTVYFVSGPHLLDKKLEDFDRWLENPKCKESTYFPEVLAGKDWRGEPVDDYYKSTIAWWSYDVDIAWTLDPKVAKTLITAFANHIHDKKESA